MHLPLALFFNVARREPHLCRGRVGVAHAAPPNELARPVPEALLKAADEGRPVGVLQRALAVRQPVLVGANVAVARRRVKGLGQASLDPLGPAALVVAAIRVGQASKAVPLVLGHGPAVDVSVGVVDLALRAVAVEGPGLPGAAEDVIGRRDVDAARAAEAPLGVELPGKHGPARQSLRLRLCL